MANKSTMPLDRRQLTILVAFLLATIESKATISVVDPSSQAADSKQTNGLSTSTIPTGIQPLLEAFKETSAGVVAAAPSAMVIADQRQGPNVTPLLAPAGITTSNGVSLANPISSPPAAPAAVTPQTQVGGSITDEPITQLDYSNINDEILNRNTANLVYFQANFNKCRNCERFFDTWKKLALDIRWWGHLVRLFVIDCSDDDNLEVCRRAGATEFPQVRFYWVRSNSLSQDGQRLRILGKSVHAMRHLITDKLMDSYMEHNRLLAKRNEQQQASAKSGQKPPSGLSSLVLGTNQQPASAAGVGPLTSFLPLLNQIMKPSSSTGAGDGLLSSIMGMFGMASPGAGGKSTGGAGSSGLSLASLMGGLGSFQGITQIVNALMSLASWRRSLSIQPLPANWPELEPIELQDTQRLVQLLPPRVSSLLVMETQEFLYTGLEVMLDLNPYSNQTYIARVRDERSQLTKNLTGRDDVQAPALIHVSESHEIRLITTAPKYSNDEELRRLFVRAFDKRLSKHLKRVWSPVTTAAATSADNTANKSQEDEEILSRVDNIYMDDLLNTIRASLMDQVFRHSDLSEDQYNALVKYIYALINYFPFQNGHQLNFFKRLHAWLQNQVSPIDMAEYRKQFHDIDDALGKKRDWIACKSLSSINAVPVRDRKSVTSLLFENPAQFGKVVSNITRLFRTNQQKVAQLKSLAGMFATSNSNPVLLTNKNAHGNTSHRLPLGTTSSTTSTTTTSKPNRSSNKNNRNKADQDDSSSSSSNIEKLVKSLTSGSLGSDSSILKLISSALTGGAGDDNDEAPTSGGHLSKRPAAKSKYAREYSCGAWKLAHVMVVSEYSKDSFRKDVKHLVLHSLYQFMLHFYSCATCGNRVSDIGGEFRIQLDDHLQDQGDSIMLLWKLHNRVNKRLELELRPGSPPKQQFPSESLCPKCRAPMKSANRLDEPATNPSWQEKLVLNFLIHQYKAQNIITNQDDDGTSSSSSSSSSLSPLAIITLLLATFFATTLNVRSDAARFLSPL